MSIGLAEGARRAARRIEVALAVEADRAVAGIFRRNVDPSLMHEGNVLELFDGSLGAVPTPGESRLSTQVGPISILIGGPPCQGHSDLNNHTRRADPKNALYLTMARAAEVLQPDVVIIENVSTVQWDRSGVVQTTKAALERLDYAVRGSVLDSTMFGVPQRRRRFVLLASRVEQVNPSETFEAVIDAWNGHRPRTVDWAIRDLLDVTSASTFDTPSVKSEENAARMAYLFERGIYNLPNSERPACHRQGGHSYVSVYGRLRWNRPAQTITTGFGSMGQGRYVHPQRRRTITPHEAARLQTFPDWFDFGEQTPRGVLAKAIGNAVPPLLMAELGRHVVAGLAARAASDRKLA